MSGSKYRADFSVRSTLSSVSSGKPRTNCSGWWAADVTEILDADALLAAAAADTGLSDWGEPGFRDRFAGVVEAVRSAGMNEAGQRRAASNIHWLLSDRLRW